MYRAYIRNALKLNEKPETFYRVVNGKYTEDLLTKANSSFEVLESTKNIESSDMFCLLNDSGKVEYIGIVTSVEDHQINTSQIQSFYAGTWLYKKYPSATSLEQEVALALTDYANGVIDGSSDIDLLMKQEKGAIEIAFSPVHTSIKLPTQDNQYTTDFEDFIYSLYDKYNIIFKFNVPYYWESTSDIKGSVLIDAPVYDKLIVSDNTHIIKNITPEVEIYENNKLIIYSQDGTYRGTYYGTKNGITQDPESIDRFKKINTSIVFSDDSLSIIEAQHLRNDMYNHYISFDLITKNNLYNFKEWHLGQPILVFHNKITYDTVFTGYEKEIKNGEDSGVIKIKCGKVRVTLTDILNIRNRKDKE